MPSSASWLRWRGHPRMFWLLLFGALLSRALTILLSADLPLLGDAWQYHHTANELLAGEPVAPYWPPGLPYYLAGWKWLFGTSEAAARWAMLPWLAALLLLLRPLLRAWLRPSRTQLLLGLLLVYPDLWLQSVEPLSHLPVAVGLVAAVLALRRGAAWKWILLAGTCLGLAALFRPSVALLAVPLPFLLIYRSRNLRWAALWGPVAALVLAVSGALSQQHGRYIFLNDANARNLYLGNNAWTHWYRTWEFGSTWDQDPALPEGFRSELARLDALPETDRSAAYWQAAGAEIRTDPGAFAVRTGSRMRTLLVFDTAYGARQIRHYGRRTWGYGTLLISAGLFFALLAGMWWTCCRELPPPLRRARWILGGIMLLYLAPYWLSFSHPTYHLAILPLGLAFFALGWAGRNHAPLTAGRQRWLWIGWVLLALVQGEWIGQMLGSGG